MEGVQIPVEVVGLMVSSVHAFEGRPEDGPRADPAPVGHSEVEVRAGLGMVGDRYFGQTVHRNAAVTFLDAGAMDELAATRQLPAAPDPLLLRRNIILRGFQVEPSPPIGGRTAPASPAAASPSTPAPARSSSRPIAPPTPAPGWTPYSLPAPSKPSEATPASAPPH